MHGLPLVVSLRMQDFAFRRGIGWGGMDAMRVVKDNNRPIGSVQLFRATTPIKVSVW